MSEITSIETQVKDKQRCNVFVDGRFYCGIKLEVAMKYRLKAGMQIEKSMLDEIQLETEKSQALDKAMTHLSATLKTKKQMYSFLTKKGYTQAVADYVVGKLENYKFIDDEAYCRSYIKSVNGKGKRAVEAELLKRGIEREVIEEVLGETEENLDEAIALLEKYLKNKPADRQTLYKGYKYLLSRGYSIETAKSALEKAGLEDEDN